MSFVVARFFGVGHFGVMVPGAILFLFFCPVLAGISLGVLLRADNFFADRFLSSVSQSLSAPQ